MNITNEIQLKRSKLESKRNHLEALLSKRARLDYEIKVLKKSLNKSAHSTEKSVKEQIDFMLKEKDIVLESGTPCSLNYLLEQVSGEEIPSEISKLDEVLIDVYELTSRT